LELVQQHSPIPQPACTAVLEVTAQPLRVALETEEDLVLVLEVAVVGLPHRHLPEQTAEQAVLAVLH